MLEQQPQDGATSAPSTPEITLPAPRNLPADVLPDAAPAARGYEVGAEVARGGMGIVLRARDRAIRRDVAMKVMLDHGTPDTAARFVSEAQVTGQLEHPGIVPVYDLAVGADGRPFYTMKFVDGVTLRKALDGLRARDPEVIGRYPLARLLTIFQKVCDALAFAHARGVIHRDVKPENIMIGAYGEVLVLDWGLAKVLSSSPGVGAAPAPAAPPGKPVSTARWDQGDTAQTMAGYILGSPGFMSPEQADGEVDRLDARSDVFALGAILYHLLTLEFPFRGRTLEAVLEKVRRAAVGPATLCTAGRMRLPHLPGGRVPASLSAVAAKAMALRPADRYATVQALQRDVEAFQNGFATSAEEAGLLKRLRLLARRHRAASVGLATVLLVGGTLGGRALLEGRRAERALANLRQTVPTLISQAQSCIEGGKFGEALTKIGFARQIAPDDDACLLLQAQVLQAALRLDEAAAAYRELLARAPGDSARRNLDACERALRATQDGGAPDVVALRRLYDLMKSEGRMAQAVPVAAKLGLGRAQVDDVLAARLETWRRLAGWTREAEAKRIVRNPDGSLALSFEGLPISDLSPLKSLPVSDLNLKGTAVRDLSPLAGLRLLRLNLSNTRVADLAPLRGMPLEYLWLLQCRDVADLEPLRGMPLAEVNIGQTAVRDLAPLAGSPLRTLLMECLNLTSLEQVAGLPLERIVALNSPTLADISVVRRLPRLQTLELDRCAAVTNLGELAACTRLEVLTLPRLAAPPEYLRGLRSLRAIGLDAPSLQPACEFLQRYWPDDPTLARSVALLRQAQAAFAAAGVSDLRAYQILPLEDGTLDVSFAHRSACANLAPFAGLPISVLDISNTDVADLSAVRGMPLRRLVMHKTPVSDLAPLASCDALRELSAWSTRVRNLAPLHRLPLETLLIAWCPVTDLAPLAGMPLRRAALDGLPATDLRPLQSCVYLEELSIPERAADLAPLRELHRLRRLSTRWLGNLEGQPVQTAEAFWRERAAGDPR